MVYIEMNKFSEYGLHWSEKLQVNYHYVFLYIEYRVKVIYIGLNNKV